MPERVREIKRSIETRQDFTGLANGGEDAVVRWARGNGLNGRVLICEWQQTYRQAQAQVERGHKKTLNQESGSGVFKPEAAVMRDLDYWADDEPVEPDDDPDDSTDQTTKTCDSCRGLGRTADGATCERCSGSGRVPIDPDQEDDNDDDED